MNEYQKRIETGNYQKAINDERGRFSLAIYSLEPSLRNYNNNNNSGNGGITLKALNEAIKNKTATAEMIESAIKSMKAREIRAKELDKEKVHKQVHTEFEERNKNITPVNGITEADNIAMRHLVYDSLRYHGKEIVNPVLFPETFGMDRLSVYDRLLLLTEQELAFLIRVALMIKPDSKLPQWPIGQTLYKVALQSGINIARIEADQDEKSARRSERLKIKILELEKRIAKLVKH